MQHQLRCLGDGHEITCDFGVCDGEWAAIAKLLTEHGHHTAAGAQHVAKPNHAKTGVVRGGLLCHGLQNELGHAFAGTHEVGGAHGFVGGDQHKMRYLGRLRGLHHIERAKHVVKDTL